ncbi:MAG: hypothetical protein WD533_02935 [Dehalococcoidia bacterium]
MLARVLEEGGLSTAALALIKEHAERVKPPRALFVPFPFGYALGKADDPEFQHKVIKAGLDLLGSNQCPVLAEFPEDGEVPPQLLQATAARKEASNADGDPADEITGLRGYYERWVEKHSGRTGVGLSGVPQRRFRGLVRYLDQYALGNDPGYEEKPADMPHHRFMRLAADDLKAFCVEARMEQRPDQRDNELQRWFWSETATGNLLARVAERLAASEDPEVQRAAQGIAR